MASLRTPGLSPSSSSSSRPGTFNNEQSIKQGRQSLGQGRLWDSTPSLKRRLILDEMEDIENSPKRSSPLNVTPRADLPQSNNSMKKQRTFESPKTLDDSISAAISTPSLSTRLENFKMELEEERKANKLFELSMQNWLKSPAP